MDREQLLKNLQELENQLRGVKSATEQVNAVVRTDKELISSVNAYTQKAQEFIAAIREQYTVGVADVKDAAVKSFKASSDEFARTVASTQEKFVAQVKGFEDVINNCLKPLINSELKPLPEKISKAADACLKEMKGIEDSLKKTSEEVRESLKAVSDGYVKEMKTLENEVSQKMDSLNSKADEVKDFMQTVPDQVKVAIGASVQEFEKIVEGQNTQIDRLRKQNLFLAIIVVVGIIVMAVIKFV